MKVPGRRADPGDRAVDREGADVDTDLAATDARSDAGVVERLPGDLEQHALLRVHHRRLPRRDAEELRVELPYRVGEEPAAARVHPARRIRIRIVELLGSPAVAGNGNDTVAASQQEIPVAIGIGDSTGQPAADSYDRDLDHSVTSKCLGKSRCHRT